MFKINSKTYVMCAVTLVVGIALGFLLGSSGKDQTYQAGLAQGRAEVEQEYQKKIEKAFPSIPEPTEIFSVSGKIFGIEDKVMTLEITLPVSNPLEEPEVQIMTVKITGTTEIVKQALKSPEELAEEEEAFVRGETDIPPMPYKEVGMDFSELKAGDVVTAEAEESIKGKTQFEAAKIVLIFVL